MIVLNFLNIRAFKNRQKSIEKYVPKKRVR